MRRSRSSTSRRCPAATVTATATGASASEATGRLMQEIAEVYARSLFQVAKEHGVLDEVHEQLDELTDVLEESRELQTFFFSPYFSSQEKKDGIAKVLDGADERFQRFLELL